MMKFTTVVILVAMVIVSLYTESTEANKRKMLNKKKKPRHGGNTVQLPLACKKSCNSSCAQTKQCERDCFQTCSESSATTPMQCRQQCRGRLDCQFPACTNCRSTCMNEIAICYRENCTSKCGKVDISAFTKRRGGKGRKGKLAKPLIKAIRACKQCRIKCKKEELVEDEDTAIEK